MSRLVLSMMTTLDGCVEAPDGGLGWHYADADHEERAKLLLRSVDALAFGRVTFDGMAEFWPTATSEDSIIVDEMNELPKYLFSRARTEAAWRNSRVLRGEAVAHAAALRAAPGGTILILGSNTLATALLDAGHLDEVQLMLCPIALGSGTPLFHGLAAERPMRLVNSTPRPNGVMDLTYVPEFISRA